jgi:hypothetical protein
MQKFEIITRNDNIKTLYCDICNKDVPKVISFNIPLGNDGCTTDVFICQDCLNNLFNTMNEPKLKQQDDFSVNSNDFLYWAV